MNDICLISLVSAGVSFAATFLIAMSKRDPRKPGDGPQNPNVDITIDL